VPSVLVDSIQLRVGGRDGDAVTAIGDVRGAIGFSSLAVLVYYAIANASAWTLEPGRRPPRWLSALGLSLIGCLAIAVALPAKVCDQWNLLALGAIVFVVRRVRGTNG
jgi:APA family basic amino acid/polyamine antiporter